MWGECCSLNVYTQNCENGAYLSCTECQFPINSVAFMNSVQKIDSQQEDDKI